MFYSFCTVICSFRLFSIALEQSACFGHALCDFAESVGVHIQGKGLMVQCIRPEI